MNEAKDFSVAYTLWMGQGTVLYQSSFVLFGNSLAKGPIIENLRAHAGSNFPVDWTQVAAISYDILEAEGNRLSRYSAWVDSAELDSDDGGLETVAAAPIPMTVEVSPQENTAVLEAVEEILRENLPETEPEEA